MYRLEKNIFKAGTLKECSDNRDYWHQKTPTQRLRAAVYLIRTAHRIGDGEFPRMEKMLTWKGTLEEQNRVNKNQLQ